MRSFILFLCCVICLSCEREVQVTPNPPQVVFSGPAYATTFTKGKVYISVKATSAAALAGMQIMRSENGAPAKADTSFALSGSEWNGTYVFTAPDSVARPATIRLFFIVTDALGSSSSATFVITMGDEPLELGVGRIGMIYHRLATSRNVLWDLVNNIPRTLSDSANADMINLSGTSDNFAEGWRVPAIIPATVFVKASQLDYANAGVKTVINSLNNPSSRQSYVVNEVDSGDVILFVLRNGAVGVMKIKQINTSGTINDQRIVFEYKKQG
jgi:hypothetical protein